MTDFKLTADAYVRDGFGTKPAFAGLVAEDQGKVIGYLLYHFGYDSDRAARNMHIVDLYVDRAARNQGVGKALMARAASIAREASTEEMIWSVYQSNTIAATVPRYCATQAQSSLGQQTPAQKLHGHEGNPVEPGRRRVRQVPCPDEHY